MAVRYSFGKTVHYGPPRCCKRRGGFLHLSAKGLFVGIAAVADGQHLYVQDRISAEVGLPNS